MVKLTQISDSGISAARGSADISWMSVAKLCSSCPMASAGKAFSAMGSTPADGAGIRQANARPVVVRDKRKTLSWASTWIRPRFCSPLSAWLTVDWRMFKILVSVLVSMPGCSAINDNAQAWAPPRPTDCSMCLKCERTAAKTIRNWRNTRWSGASGVMDMCDEWGKSAWWMGCTDVWSAGSVVVGRALKSRSGLNRTGLVVNRCVVKRLNIQHAFIVGLKAFNLHQNQGFS